MMRLPCSFANTVVVDQISVPLSQLLALLDARGIVCLAAKAPAPPPSPYSSCFLSPLPLALSLPFTLSEGRII